MSPNYFFNWAGCRHKVLNSKEGKKECHSVVTFAFHHSHFDFGSFIDLFVDPDVSLKVSCSGRVSYFSSYVVAVNSVSLTDCTDQDTLCMYTFRNLIGWCACQLMLWACINSGHAKTTRTTKESGGGRDIWIPMVKSKYWSVLIWSSVKHFNLLVEEDLMGGTGPELQSIANFCMSVKWASTAGSVLKNTFHEHLKI